MADKTIPEDAPLCACGCGEKITSRHGTQWRRFLPRHHARVQPKGERAYRWSGGTIKDSHGYILLKMRGHHMADRRGYVRRCRLIAEEKLGRALMPREVVHHINQICDDDRPENIQVMTSQAEHVAEHNHERSGIRNPNAKLTPEQILTARAMVGTMSLRAIGRHFGVSLPTITNAIRGLTYKDVA